MRLPFGCAALRALALLAVLAAEADIEKASAAFEQYKVQGGVSLGDLKLKLRID
ncbi:MAG: hypothetical protein ACLP1W_20630 [Rhodomicrobium sp.]